MSEITEQEVEYLVGRFDAIIREIEGEKTFQHLDEIRRLAIARRRHAKGTEHPADQKPLSTLRVHEAHQIVHAFSLFFQFVNVCEERARLRQSCAWLQRFE